MITSPKFPNTDNPSLKYPLGSVSISYRKGLLLTASFIVLVYGFGLLEVLALESSINLTHIEAKVRTAILFCLLIYFLSNFAVEGLIDLARWKRAFLTHELEFDFSHTSYVSYLDEVEFTFAGDDFSDEKRDLAYINKLQIQNRKLRKIHATRVILAYWLPLSIGFAALVLLMIIGL